MAIPAIRTRTFGRAAGFTYIGLLIAVVIMGIALSAVGVVWRTQAQREREQQLLFIGRDFERAIASYYKAGRQFPQEIDDLLDDKRGPLPAHHLRRFHNDPMTGAQDWNIIRVGALGITGTVFPVSFPASTLAASRSNSACLRVVSRMNRFRSR